jgi:Carboxypeptidase regulatory-like domain
MNRFASGEGVWGSYLTVRRPHPKRPPHHYRDGVDASNEVVPNANVLVTNVETGAQYQTQTTSTGNYALASLPVLSRALSSESKLR